MLLLTSPSLLQHGEMQMTNGKRHEAVDRVKRQMHSNATPGLACFGAGEDD